MYIKLIYILIEKKVFNQFLLTFTEYFMNFIKIINFRMKNKNSDNINVKYLIGESKTADISVKEK